MPVKGKQTNPFFYVLAIFLEALRDGVCGIITDRNHCPCFRVCEGETRYWPQAKEAEFLGKNFNFNMLWARKMSKFAVSNY